MLSLDGLNPPQYAAVTYHGKEHCLILAGAGSGKTRVLTHRIAWLLSQGVPSYAILAITFTNKAAQEMRERALRLIDEERDSHLSLSTFHAFGARFLRRYGSYIGLTPSFSIYGESEQRTLVKKIMGDMGLLHASSEILDSEQKRNTAIIQTMAEDIAKLKEKGLGVDAAKTLAKNHDEKTTASVYEVYERKLIENNAVDFAGLLLWPLVMLREFEDIRTTVQRRYRYILVDEFQDTNGVQLDLLAALMGTETQLTAVGDDDQAIYTWRGADPTAILEFSSRFGACEVFKLEQNYRSTKPILNCAANLIACNRIRTEKRLWTDADGGEPVHFVAYDEDRDETHDILRKIVRKRNQSHAEWSDFAILFRKNSMSIGFERTCAELSIPYQIVGSLGFFEREEIVDLMAYLRVLVNPLDSVSFRRIANKPTRGIGEKTIDKLLDLTEKKAQFGVPPQNALFEILSDIKDGRCKIPRTGAKFAEGCAQLYDVFYSLRDWQSLDLRSILQTILDKTQFMDHLKKQMAKKELEFDDAKDRIESLFSTLASFQPQNENSGNGLAEFLESMSLVRPESDARLNSVKLMTIHAAKGLEFDTVFIAGVEEGTLPLERGGICDTEEERRLMYVAITRAKKTLFISHAESRFEYGTLKNKSPSRFLEEMKGEDDSEDLFDESEFESQCDNRGVSKRDAYASQKSSAQLAWAKKSSPKRKIASAYGDLSGDFANEVGGGIVSAFGKNKRKSLGDDNFSDAPFYEEHSVGVHKFECASDSESHAKSNSVASHALQALSKNHRPIEIGSVVKHAVHGKGNVVGMERGANGAVKVSVSFEQSGIRTILANFLIVI